MVDEILQKATYEQTKCPSIPPTYQTVHIQNVIY